MANPSPKITFTVNLTNIVTDAIGPVTNERDVYLTNPDQFQNSPDQGRIESAARSSTLSTYAPTYQINPNKVAKHGDTIVEYGMKAIYLRDTYGIGYAPNDRAILTVVSVE